MAFRRVVFESGERVALPSDGALHAARERFRSIIRSLIASNSAVIGHGVVRVTRTAKDARMTVEPPPSLRGSDAFVAIAAERLGQLLALEGHRVKECPAPRTVGRKGDPVPCGGWFVGRPNQRCCSPTCANRDSTRAARFGRAIETYRGFRIDLRSHELYDVADDGSPIMRGEWQPVAFISHDAGVREWLAQRPSGEPLTFRSKTRADMHARRIARAAVDDEIARRTDKKEK
jgi:hypothetical protein